MDVQAVHGLYKSIGGTYTKITEASSDQKTVARPVDKLKWTFAKEQCSTNERVCLTCNGKLTVDTPGKIVKCCNTIMDAPKKEAADCPDKTNSMMMKELPEEEVKIQPSDEEKSKTRNIIDKLGDYKKSKKLVEALVIDEDKPEETYWVVKEGSEPIFKVALKDVFQDDPSHPSCLRRFKGKDYGRNLVGMLKKFGVKHVTENIFGGRANTFGQLNSNAPDFLAAEPTIEDEESDTGNKPNNNQAGQSLIEQEVGDDLLEDKADKHEVLELVSDAIVPIMIASGAEITVDDFVRELQAMVNDSDALAEWKGQLEEKIRLSSQHVEDEGDQAQANVAGPETPPPTQQPMATAPVAQPQVAAKLRSQMARLSDELAKTTAEREKADNLAKKLYSECKRIEAKAVDLRQHNEMLLKERELRLVSPRARKLAQRMVVIGITSADKVDECTTELLHMSSDNFLKKEAEVNKVHNRFESERKAKASKRELLSTEGVMPFMTAQASEDNTPGLNGRNMAKSSPRFSWTGTSEQTK